MSEVHAVMTGGYATIAGSVLAAYIFFGVSFYSSFHATFSISGGRRPRYTVNAKTAVV